MTEKLPPALVDQIADGNVVLFLGSGASIGASTTDPTIQVPKGAELADLIALKFLGPNYKGKSLQYVSQLAQSETDMFTVQKYVADLFSHFGPGSHHLMLPLFEWKAIITTNYDRIVEEAYRLTTNRLQNIEPFIKNGERLSQRLKTRSDIQYLKLHGCLSSVNDEDIPLILTPDQYVTHRNGRSRLFERMKELAYEHPFVFVGFSFEDHDIRAILHELDGLKEAKPRSYMVGPYITDEETRYWDSKKIGSLRMSFSDFMSCIGSSVAPERRVHSSARPVADHPIHNVFVVPTDELRPSDSLTRFLTEDVEYVHSGIATKSIDPKDFYKGYFDGWSAIMNNYDAERTIKDGILSEAVLIDETEPTQELYVIKGHAGAGKSVLLKRIAYDAAVSFNCICLYAKFNARVPYEPIRELYDHTKRRTFLFLDQASEFKEEIALLLKRAKKDGIPLTVITAERLSQWNTECQVLEPLLTHYYVLPYLTDREIRALLALLETHQSLGYLATKKPEDRVAELAEVAGRQLLVALLEATHGLPFREIVKSEYDGLSTSEAKSLYLTVSVLHRIGAMTRAGLISRVHSIGFSEFKSRLFKPLESIVFSQRDYRINDEVYFTRHPHIAEIVFEEVLKTGQDRFDEYIRIIGALDIDYDNDRWAFISMTKARYLLETFSNPEFISSIYRLARERSVDDPKLLQQIAIFEMEQGRLDEAERLLQEALRIEPNDAIVAHTFAELALKKAEGSRHSAQRSKYIAEAIKVCKELIAGKVRSSYPYHTLIKANVMKMEDVASDGDLPEMERVVKVIEKAISDAKQYNPNSSYILEAEASFKRALNDLPNALKFLQQAFEANKESPYLAARLTALYEEMKMLPEARTVLIEALKHKPGDKELNFRYALFLLRHEPDNHVDARHHLRRSFTKGDGRHDAQFWYARCLYLTNEIEEAKQTFKDLSVQHVDPLVKRAPKGIHQRSGKVEEYTGVVRVAEATHAFIRRDNFADDIYLYRHDQVNLDWDALKRGARVRFRLAFNYKGPIAVECQVIA